eukprot:2302234-Alexandrium_andersonii.AAC.1
MAPTDVGPWWPLLRRGSGCTRPAGRGCAAQGLRPSGPARSGTEDRVATGSVAVPCPLLGALRQRCCGL